MGQLARGAVQRPCSRGGDWITVSFDAHFKVPVLPEFAAFVFADVAFDYYEFDRVHVSILT